VKPEYYAGLVGLALVALAYFTRPKGSVETSYVIDLDSVGLPPAPSSQIRSMAQAIARAEGFYVAGSVPQRSHNPGNIKASWTGYPSTPGGITMFPSESAGWAALYHQLELIRDGRSGQYSLANTIRQMGTRWTATIGQQFAWASNVAQSLGVSVDTQLRVVLA